MSMMVISTTIIIIIIIISIRSMSISIAISIIRTVAPASETLSWISLGKRQRGV